MLRCYLLHTISLFYDDDKSHLKKVCERDERIRTESTVKAEKEDVCFLCYYIPCSWPSETKSQGVSFSGVGSGRKREKNTGWCLEELLRLCRAMLWEIKTALHHHARHEDKCTVTARAQSPRTLWSQRPVEFGSTRRESPQCLYYLDLFPRHARDLHRRRHRRLASISKLADVQPRTGSESRRLFLVSKLAASKTTSIASYLIQDHRSRVSILERRPWQRRRAALGKASS